LKFVKSLKNAMLAAMLFTAGVANAGLYQFQLTGDYTASWKLDANPIVESFERDVGFQVIDVAGDFAGASGGLADLTFFHVDAGGGLLIEDFYAFATLLVSDGPQLYTGKEGSPLFSLGTFALTEFGGDGRYSLTITDLDALPPVDVPEPASVALLLGGLGLLAAARKRRSAT